MNLLYRISLLCGILPLSTGVIIFVTWIFTQADWLMGAGIYTLFTGLLFFCVGIISILILTIKQKSNPTKNYWKKIIISTIILLVNFPVAITIIGAVSYVEGTSYVTVENNYRSQVENIYLSDRIHRYHLGSVAPGTTKVEKIHFKSEGSVLYFLEIDGVKHEGTIFGYVTGGLSVSGKIVINDQGKITISEI